MSPDGLDAAALPELVADVRAPADQEHDARRLLHREPRKPSEPPRAARGARLQHERSRGPVPGRGAPELEHQLARRPAGQHPDSLRGLQRNRGPGAAEVSPVPEHRMARSPAGAELVPRPGGRARAAPLGRAPVPPRLHLLQAEEQRRGERAGQRGDQRRRPGSRQLGHRPTTGSAWTTRRTCSWPASPGTSRPPLPTTGRGPRRPSSAAGTSAASCATRAAGPCRSRWPTTWAACSSTPRSARTAPGTDAVVGGGDFDPLTDNYFNKAAWSDPGPLTFGNAPRADGSVRGFKNFNEDLTLAKNFRLKGDMQDAVQSPRSATSSTGRRSATRTRTSARPRSARSTRSATRRGPSSSACGSTTDSDSRVAVGTLEKDVPSSEALESPGRRPRRDRVLSLAVLLFGVLAAGAALAAQAQAALQRAAALVQQGRLQEADQQAQLALVRSRDAGRGLFRAGRDPRAAAPPRGRRRSAPGSHPAGPPASSGPS